MDFRPSLDVNPDDNPYTPGAGARPPALVGRDSDVDAFRSAIARLGQGRHARSIILSGLRGVGKTVLLGEFHNLARESGWTSTGVLECSEADALPVVIGELVHRALRRLNRGRRASEALARAAGALGSFGVSIDRSEVRSTGSSIGWRSSQTQHVSCVTTMKRAKVTIGISEMPRSATAS